MTAVALVLALSITPRLCLAPCEAKILVRVDEDWAHRWLEVDWDEGRSVRQLCTMAQEPECGGVFLIQVLLEMEGTHPVTATIYDTEGVHARVATTIEVIGPGAQRAWNSSSSGSSTGPIWSSPSSPSDWCGNAFQE